MQLPFARTQQIALRPVDRAATRPRRVLVVGSGLAARNVARDLAARADRTVVGLIDDQPTTTETEWPVLGGHQAVERIIEENAIDEVVVVYSPSWQQELAESLLRNGEREVAVKVVPTAYEAMVARPNFETAGDMPLLSISLPRASRFAEMAKRALDLLLSILALVFVGPVLLLVMALVRLTSRGPAIFSQERVGKDGCHFNVHKLRTMYEDAEAASGARLSTGKSDDRITPIGRFLRASRLDEMPQLINVLRGEMSLVGPRPERPCFVRKFKQEVPGYSERHRVRPGITGLAQIYGRYDSSAT
jgi:exopolysaccharide biosynthesis polyprenyl glycosylphosphotransferase